MLRSEKYERRLMNSKCREMMRQFGDVFLALQEEILYEQDREAIDGDTAFAYAKRQIRRDGVKEGMKLLIGRITKYANVQSE